MTYDTVTLDRGFLLKGGCDDDGGIHCLGSFCFTPRFPAFCPTTPSLHWGQFSPSLSPRDLDMACLRARWDPRPHLLIFCHFFLVWNTAWCLVSNLRLEHPLTQLRLGRSSLGRQLVDVGKPFALVLLIGPWAISAAPYWEVAVPLLPAPLATEWIR